MAVSTVQVSATEYADRQKRIEAMVASAIKAIIATSRMQGGEPDNAAMLLACMHILSTNIATIPTGVRARLIEDVDIQYMAGMIARQMKELENPQPPQKMDS